MRNLSINKIIAIIFSICIFTIAFISDYKIMNFYINNEIDYNEWNAETDSKFETDYISNLWLKYHYVNLNGAMREVLGQHQMNGVIKLNNGYLSQSTSYIDDDIIESDVERTKRFREVLSEKGIDYIWFTLPYVVDRYDTQLPLGAEDDFGNDNLDRLTKLLREGEVEVVDLREIIYNQGLETYDLFYRTDHHWTTKGGFWAYNQIVDYIEKRYNVEADTQVRNIDNYNVVTYKEWHLGSRGQRTGKYYAGIDDFDLITPKFDTYIQVYGTEKGGSLTDVMFNMMPLQKNDYMSRYTYDYVLNGTCGYWHNPNASVDMKVMIIGDSMVKAVMPYLALTFTDVAYGAYCADTTSVTSELINNYQPDVVISLNYVTNIAESAFVWEIIDE